MWECQKCHERGDDSFDVCWKCGTSRDGVEDPAFEKAEEDEAGMPRRMPPPRRRAVAAPTAGEPHQVREAVCSKCGSDRVIPAVRVLDRNGEYPDRGLSVRLDRNPDALIFKGSEVVELKGRVCCRCGVVEMYAVDAESLWTAYEAQKRS